MANADATATMPPSAVPTISVPVRSPPDALRVTRDFSARILVRVSGLASFVTVCGRFADGWRNLCSGPGLLKRNGGVDLRLADLVSDKEGEQSSDKPGQKAANQQVSCGHGESSVRQDDVRPRAKTVVEKVGSVAGKAEQMARVVHPLVNRRSQRVAI